MQYFSILLKMPQKIFMQNITKSTGENTFKPIQQGAHITDCAPLLQPRLPCMQYFLILFKIPQKMFLQNITKYLKNTGIFLNPPKKEPIIPIVLRSFIHPRLPCIQYFSIFLKMPPKICPQYFKYLKKYLEEYF